MQVRLKDIGAADLMISNALSELVENVAGNICRLGGVPDGLSGQDVLASGIAHTFLLDALGREQCGWLDCIAEERFFGADFDYNLMAAADLALALIAAGIIWRYALELDSESGGHAIEECGVLHARRNPVATSAAIRGLGERLGIDIMFENYCNGVSIEHICATSPGND